MVRSKTETGKKILAQMILKDLTFKDLAERVGRSEKYCKNVIYGQVRSEELEKRLLEVANE